MRVVTVVFMSIVFLVLSHAGGEAAPWCAHYGGRGGGGGTNCGFYSFSQCQATVIGTGGFCARNPFEYGREGRRRYR